MTPDALAATSAAALPCAPALWWERPDLRYVGRDLHLAGRNLAELARQAGTPAYVYSGPRVLENLRRLKAALESTGLPHAIRYAMKANRHGPLLTWMKASGLCGIDACSPNELRFAVQCGFRPEEVSYTATSVSEADLAVLARHPETWVNADSLSTLRRLAAVSPGREIGIRVNPALGVGYGENQLLRYSGERTSKFGIYRDRFEEALALAASHGLTVRGIHFHVGWGYLNAQLPAWAEVVRECLWFLDRVPQARLVNLGGGLGVPHAAGDRPLDLEAWAAVIRDSFAGRGIEVWVEPGDYVVKDAGVLLLQANTVERKRATTFVGVDGGFNLAVEPVFYRLPCEPVPARLHQDPARAWAADALAPVSIAGNINEALDLWAEALPFPAVEEGDVIAFLNAGGYAAAMGSNHCMRAQASEHLLL
ncbi:diaminopimelate decarboxylase [Rhodospirillum centenum]|uniref:Diaminopimelate decarboxylase, putative n=1 Tax=Rhodospirillum centenum (strain ATCC 51521 / SW) TaxID=414684 RepID=B6ISK3_RHOCS|nr:diaminopimelate decarboxylase [Rhodospirillum centenum]ACI98439.1 diaminopimelate decarboxylase, putative [Rhodospirillum centenum SW]